MIINKVNKNNNMNNNIKNNNNNNNNGSLKEPQINFFCHKQTKYKQLQQ